ncbi:MAG TPA: UDP-N-acetylmuramate--L-alanine ligase [Flavobacteriaceae bacterium]|nr:UDP-N-acetylmuramate--L-alanine ligase [Flavobacteriaceae bacterium]
MKLFNHIQHIYFLGIGGIGMSALAQYFVLNGKQVAGYDKTPGKMTEKLIDLDIAISFEDNVDQIPESFDDPGNTLIVYTPAVPKDLRILEHFKSNGFQIEKRAAVLGKITKEIPTLAVAGTHGKTTTSAILAHLLKQSGFDITAFLGGIAENYNSNFIHDGKDACVVEADEYDRSFLKLHPKYAAITSMDPDHLDIYGNVEELINSFEEFSNKLPAADNLFYKKGLNLEGNSVGIEMEADFEIRNIKIHSGRYHFDLKHDGKKISNFEFSLPGRHNLMNAGMALAMAISYGATPEKLKKALQSFKGVERRFSYRLKTGRLVVVEDYAHHPEEIKAVYQAAREMYPDKNIMAVFQPHLYSRTRDFAEEFATSLSKFDQVVLLPIYPARELPIPGIDAKYLLRLMSVEKKKMADKKELPETVKNMQPEVVLVLGAGDIGNEVEPLLKALNDEN